LKEFQLFLPPSKIILIEPVEIAEDAAGTRWRRPPAGNYAERGERQGHRGDQRAHRERLRHESPDHAAAPASPRPLHIAPAMDAGLSACAQYARAARENVDRAIFVIVLAESRLARPAQHWQGHGFAE